VKNHAKIAQMRSIFFEELEFTENVKELTAERDNQIPSLVDAIYSATFYLVSRAVQLST